MILLLTILTALAVLVLFGALAVYVAMIADGLNEIGGKPSSYLAKINFGVRAIETETSALAPQVTQLNQGLRALATGLKAVDDSLGATITAVSNQEAYRKP